MSIFSRISRVMANYQYTISQIFRDPRSPEFGFTDAGIPAGKAPREGMHSKTCGQILENRWSRP